MNEQLVITQYACRSLPKEIAYAVNGRRIFAVCDRALLKQDEIRELIDDIGCKAVFSDFEANPDFDSVLAGKKLFEKLNCDTAIAFGGGSSLDVAKCIKYYFGCDTAVPFPAQAPRENNITLIAVPTTAGTGSEATRFAVVYYKGEKQSVEHESLIPQYVLFDSALVETLPVYQRASTAFDALCHAVEALWSVNSTEQSREFSNMAMALFFANYEGYIGNYRAANEKMLACANYSGRAINIAKTTAAHAMSYGLTKMKNISHGHAALLCLAPVMRYISENIEKCSDIRGKEALCEAFEELQFAFVCETPAKCAEALEAMAAKHFAGRNITLTDSEIDALISSVNLQRLANSPVPFDEKAIRLVYKEVASFCERNGG